MNSGIYTITCLVSNKIYVGRAKNVEIRLRAHRNDLVNNIHPNTHLQASFNLYGECNFKFELLEEYEEEFLCSMENYWCNLLNVHDRKFGYNIEPTSPYGKTSVSQETKEKLRKLNTGKKASQKTKNRMGESHKGHSVNMTTKWKENISMAHIGVKKGKFTEKHKRKIGEGNSKPIVQLTLEGKFIKRWNSATEAAINLQMNSHNIRAVVTNRHKSSGGFKWITENQFLLNKMVLKN